LLCTTSTSLRGYLRLALPCKSELRIILPYCYAVFRIHAALLVISSSQPGFSCVPPQKIILRPPPLRSFLSIKKSTRLVRDFYLVRQQLTFTQSSHIFVATFPIPKPHTLQSSIQISQYHQTKSNLCSPLSSHISYGPWRLQLNFTHLPHIPKASHHSRDNITQFILPQSKANLSSRELSNFNYTLSILTTASMGRGGYN
jgi:hypothetical protein